MDTSLTYYLVIQVKTLSFVKLVILSNSSRIWTKLYFHQKIRKYEVILPIIMLKTYFLFSVLMEENKPYKKDPRNSN